ncbi:trichohyalin-like [Clytia hemisphaerica]|uniref:trichohyalin-like n=1 Tax=Clytia hemisphaerica TaxID=252671 RepID=UPI0034D425C0
MASNYEILLNKERENLELSFGLERHGIKVPKGCDPLEDEKVRKFLREKFLANEKDEFDSAKKDRQQEEEEEEEEEQEEATTQQQQQQQQQQPQPLLYTSRRYTAEEYLDRKSGGHAILMAAWDEEIEKGDMLTIRPKAREARKEAAKNVIRTLQLPDSSPNVNKFAKNLGMKIRRTRNSKKEKEVARTLDMSLAEYKRSKPKRAKPTEEEPLMLNVSNPLDETLDTTNEDVQLIEEPTAPHQEKLPSQDYPPTGLKVGDHVATCYGKLEFATVDGQINIDKDGKGTVRLVYFLFENKKKGLVKKKKRAPFVVTEDSSLFVLQKVDLKECTGGVFEVQNFEEVQRHFEYYRDNFF